jgi:hypothetical protein
MNGAATFGAHSSPRQLYCAVHKTHNCGRGGSGGDAGNYTGDNGYTLANCVVTNDHSAIDGSGNPVDAGGFDSGGSFDSAGGS